MQLRMAISDRCYRVARIVGREKQKKQLQNMGLVPDAQLRVVSALHNNLILLVKNTRIAISEELAQKVLVEEVPVAAYEACCIEEETKGVLRENNL